jgi:hypothetical protein
MKGLVFTGWVVLLSSCTQASPCEVRGGRCTRVDVACGVDFVFDGYDPTCEPNSKCCLPASADGGDPNPNCAAQAGECADVAIGCPSGRTAGPAGLCTSAEAVCCVPQAVDAGH